ncbi:transcriptional regulator [Ferviditalea candida]|uniref:Transcriptional regulator n=1 Tax=Ferviditalea candida TaxID=3108399 RepID=A0ABU5ZLF3_9BACL|nr:transcriptional regulator [Paenibacillaceae bacterium T2]
MGTSATRAKNKYQAKNYDRVQFLVPKGRKDVYKAAAAAVGESLNEYIVKAIEERMEREGKV